MLHHSLLNTVAAVPCPAVGEPARGSPGSSGLAPIITLPPLPTPTFLTRLAPPRRAAASPGTHRTSAAGCAQLVHAVGGMQGPPWPSRFFPPPSEVANR